MATVAELAGQQDDPLVEEVLAILFSDQPVQRSIRPNDSRRHWQWWARDPIGQTSRIWLSFAQPLTDETAPQIENRVESALAVLIPDYATAIEATAQRVAFDEIRLDILITRRELGEISIGLTLGGPSA